MVSDHVLPPPSPNDQVATLPAPREEDLPECLSSIPAQDHPRHVDALDESIGVLSPYSAVSLFRLSQMCQHWRRVPGRCRLNGRPLIPTGSDPIASGPMADTYQGTLNGDKVYIKQARTYSTLSEDMRLDMIHAEAILWGHMSHPNILPFLGVASIPFQLVLKWVPGGNLMEYIERHPRTDRLGLSLGVSEAVKYLHSLNIAHGGLKGSNIFVDDLGHACLADFSLATIYPELQPAGLVRKLCPLRWTAPEILGGEVGVSKETDIYSFGMVMVEVLSGAAPFPGCTPTSVMGKVLYGERPERPNHPTLTDEIWALIQECLNGDPQRRPEIATVVRCLQRAIIQQDRVTDAKTSTISKSTLHSVFHRFRKSSHSPQHPESTSFGSHGGVQYTSRGPCNLLQRTRTWLRDAFSGNLSGE